MAMGALLQWLKDHKGQKYTAQQIVSYTGFNRKIVYLDLKKLRDRGEVGVELSSDHGRPSRAYYHISSAPIRPVFLKKMDQNDYFFSVEQNLNRVLEEVKNAKNLYDGCSYRVRYRDYPRKAVIKGLWTKIKDEVSDGNNESR